MLRINSAIEKKEKKKAETTILPQTQIPLNSHASINYEQKF